MFLLTFWNVTGANASSAGWLRFVIAEAEASQS